MSQITIEDLVDGAILEGFRNGTANYVESIEAELQREAIIEESGSAHDLLQNMIDLSVQEKTSEAVSENVSELSQKLNLLFGGQA